MKNRKLHKHQEKVKPGTDDNEVKNPVPDKGLSATKKSATREQKNVILMDMPEVKDIPGQENIRPPHLRGMIDITISSADEEGEGLLDDLNKQDDEDELTGNSSNVSVAERRLLLQADRPVTEEVEDKKKLSLDKTDGKDTLNEESDPSDMGNDLDIPGSELDDDNEKLGEEDEENNSYSRPV